MTDKDWSQYYAHLSAKKILIQAITCDINTFHIGKQQKLRWGCAYNQTSFARLDSLRTSQQFFSPADKGQVFLCWIRLQRIKCLAQGHNTVNLQPLDPESSTLPLCSTYAQAHRASTRGPDKLSVQLGIYPTRYLWIAFFQKQLLKNIFYPT